jgi:alcohol oxidase
MGHPTFAEGSQTATKPIGTPVEVSAPKIVYSKEDDANDEFHRRTGSLLKHNLIRVLNGTIILLVFQWKHSVCEQKSYFCIYTPHSFHRTSRLELVLHMKQGGLVDDKINLYGVQNLKIAGSYYLGYYLLSFYFIFRSQYRTRQCRS